MSDGFGDAVQEDGEERRWGRVVTVHSLGVVSDSEVLLESDGIGVKRIRVLLEGNRLELEMEFLDSGVIQDYLLKVSR